MRSAESTHGVDISNLIFLTSFGDVFRIIRPAFTRRSWPFAVMVAAAWILAVGRRTITGLIRQTDGKRHWTLWYKFFSAYRWSELVVAQAILLIGRAKGATHGRVIGGHFTPRSSARIRPACKRSTDQRTHARRPAGTGGLCPSAAPSLKIATASAGPEGKSPP